jgi:hypothetical protein
MPFLHKNKLRRLLFEDYTKDDFVDYFADNNGDFPTGEDLLDLILKRTDRSTVDGVKKAAKKKGIEKERITIDDVVNFINEPTGERSMPSPGDIGDLEKKIKDLEANQEKSGKNVKEYDDYLKSQGKQTKAQLKAKLRKTKQKLSDHSEDLKARRAKRKEIKKNYGIPPKTISQLTDSETESMDADIESAMKDLDLIQGTIDLSKIINLANDAAGINSPRKYDDTFFRPEDALKDDSNNFLEDDELLNSLKQSYGLAPGVPKKTLQRLAPTTSKLDIDDLVAGINLDTEEMIREPDTRPDGFDEELIDFFDGLQDRVAAQSVQSAFDKDYVIKRMNDAGVGHYVQDALEQISTLDLSADSEKGKFSDLKQFKTDVAGGGVFNVPYYGRNFGLNPRVNFNNMPQDVQDSLIKFGEIANSSFQNKSDTGDFFEDLAEVLVPGGKNANIKRKGSSQAAGFPFADVVDEDGYYYSVKGTGTPGRGLSASAIYLQSLFTSVTKHGITKIGTVEGSRTTSNTEGIIEFYVTVRRGGRLKMDSRAVVDKDGQSLGKFHFLTFLSGDADPKKCVIMKQDGQNIVLVTLDQETGAQRAATLLQDNEAEAIQGELKTLGYTEAGGTKPLGLYIGKQDAQWNSEAEMEFIFPTEGQENPYRFILPFTPTADVSAESLRQEIDPRTPGAIPIGANPEDYADPTSEANVNIYIKIKTLDQKFASIKERLVQAAVEGDKQAIDAYVDEMAEIGKRRDELLSQISVEKNESMRHSNLLNRLFEWAVK